MNTIKESDSFSFQKAFLIVCFLIMSVLTFGQSVIPKPNQINLNQGTFSFSNKLSISSNDALFESLMPGFVASAERFAEIELTETQNAEISLIRDSKIKDAEAYRLIITDKNITIEASGKQGCYYGLQSLIQLITFCGEDKELKCQTIEDQPRYSWRGLMLDESRHFFGVDEVKKLLDQMTLLKLNKFHWHLTDAQGWRIEIKRYPLLTEIGGKGNNSDPNAPAKYYTQEEIKEVVAYASDRFIEIIPEIDMPGHATAAVKAFPEFSGGGSEKYPDFTFNPGKPETYIFLTNILKELTTLFPSKYIHIGGDEVSFGNHQWPTLPDVKRLVQKEGLKDMREVEHYFLHQMADSILSMGKTLMGWDELVASDVNSETSLIMWWRHDKPEILEEALNKGYKVVACPRIPLYFDFVQHESHISGRKWAGRFAPVESVYSFPSEEFMPAETISNKNIVGIQANLWTETIHNPARLEFMVFPRIAALAESSWTNEKNKNYNDFEQRLKKLFIVYNDENLNYYNPYSSSPKETLGPKK